MAIRIRKAYNSENLKMCTMRDERNFILGLTGNATPLDREDIWTIIADGRLGGYFVLEKKDTVMTVSEFYIERRYRSEAQVTEWLLWLEKEADSNNCSTVSFLCPVPVRYVDKLRHRFSLGCENVTVSFPVRPGIIMLSPSLSASEARASLAVQIMEANRGREMIVQDIEERITENFNRKSHGISLASLFDFVENR